MQYCMAHPEEISKFAKVQAQVSEVKGVMMENIEKVQRLLLHLVYKLLWLMCCVNRVQEIFPIEIALS